MPTISIQELDKPFCGGREPGMLVSLYGGCGPGGPGGPGLGGPEFICYSMRFMTLFIITVTNDTFVSGYLCD